MNELKYRFETITVGDGDPEVTVSHEFESLMAMITRSDGEKIHIHPEELHMASEAMKTLERYNGYINPPEPEENG